MNPTCCRIRRQTVTAQESGWKKGLFFLKGSRSLFRRNLPHQLEQRRRKPQNRCRQKAARVNKRVSARKKKKKKAPPKEKKQQQKKNESENIQDPFPGQAAAVHTLKNSRLKVPTGLLSGSSRWKSWEARGFRSACDGACVQVECREAAPGWVWSPCSSCKRWTDLGSRLARLWPVGPCSAHGSPFGPCNLWMGQTEGKGSCQ